MHRRIVTATKKMCRYDIENKYRIWQIRYWKNIVTANFNGNTKE